MRPNLVACHRGEKRGHHSYSASSRAFRGRPRSRSVYSSPSSFAVCAVHFADPYGRPRAMLSFTASASAASIGSLTHADQFGGFGPGQRPSVGQAS